MPAELYALPDPLEKTCSKCKQVKLLSEFYEEEQAKNGRRAECKKCRNKANKIWTKKNTDKHAGYVKKWERKNPDIRRSIILKYKYGITLKDYEKLLEKQKGNCAICGGPDERQRLSVDHCHKTKKIRGLLCGSCNLALGYLRDNPKLLRMAALYLEDNS